MIDRGLMVPLPKRPVAKASSPCDVSGVAAGWVGWAVVPLLLCLIAIWPRPAAAQTTLSNERVAALIEQAAERQKIQAPAPVVNLTLDEAVRAALEHNLDIAVERLNPQALDLSIAQVRATYRPTLTSTVGDRSQAQLPTRALEGVSRVDNTTFTYNSGITQNLPWGGGNVGVSFNNSRSSTTDPFTTFNPFFTSNFTAALNQPLLRGFSIDQTRQQLTVARINRDVADVQLRATVINTIASVRNAYWDLVYATQAVDVARRSLDLAQKLVDDNRTRVEIGTMAPIDVVQAEAEAASRRQTLTQVEASLQTSELVLKRLIVGGTEDPFWKATLNPTDRPTFKPEPVSLEGAVRSALEKRTDLIQSRRQLETNEISLRLLHNQRLPAVDLFASYGLQGRDGTRFTRPNPLGPITDTFSGGYTDALRRLVNRELPNWNLQVNISYPIGQSAAEAQYARARVQLSQSLAQIKALELQVATEVTNAVLQVQNNLKRVEAATAARELGQKRLEAEQSKFEVGMSTNFFVVQAQRDLDDAVNAELRALLDYRKSLVDFERVQETGARGSTVTTVATGGGAVTVGSGRTGGAGGGVAGGGGGVGAGGTGGGPPQ